MAVMENTAAKPHDDSALKSGSWTIRTTKRVVDGLGARTSKTPGLRLVDAVLDALEEHADQFPEIVQARRAQNTVDGPLFGRREVPSKEPTHRLLIRGITREQRDIIGREAERCGVTAPYLVTAVVDHCLSHD